MDSLKKLKFDEKLLTEQSLASFFLVTEPISVFLFI